MLWRLTELDGFYGSITCITNFANALSGSASNQAWSTAQSHCSYFSAARNPNIAPESLGLSGEDQPRDYASRTNIGSGVG